MASSGAWWPPRSEERTHTPRSLPPPSQHRRPRRRIQPNISTGVRQPAVPAAHRPAARHQPRARHAAVRAAGVREDAHRAADRQGAQRPRAEDRQRAGDSGQVRGRERAENPRSLRGGGEGAGRRRGRLHAAHHHPRRDGRRLQAARQHRRRHRRRRLCRQPAAFQNRRRRLTQQYPPHRHDQPKGPSCARRTPVALPAAAHMSPQLAPLTPPPVLPRT